LRREDRGEDGKWCGIYEKIIALPVEHWQGNPAFGAGCCANLCNLYRMSRLRKMNKFVHVRMSAYDPDSVWEERMTEYGAFCTMAEMALEYFEDNMGELDLANYPTVPQIIAAIKSEKWQELIGPLNEFLYAMGNGECFQITPLDGERNLREKKPIGIEKIRERVAAMSLDELLYQAEK
jgi:hypothetical protein